ncbi:hypothetical protein LCGC14_2246190 [marine sediment metagenome]|uniref:DUF4398 domain-containing protein n=1 Tax=marine sediment metagenome TaxID=412755 RepID=A0A0F9FGJ6_9ZZZZ
MKGIPAILLMLTIFAGGCSIASTNRPFDTELMRSAESSLKRMGEALALTPDLKETGVVPDVDMAWAKYYAAQVVLAEGRVEEAEIYLKEVTELSENVFKRLVEAAAELSNSLLEGGRPL